MTTIWGVSAMSHDAALAVMVDNQIVYASHGERYSRVKNDRDLHPDQIAEALEYGDPSLVYFYENTSKKKLRQLVARQYSLLLKPSPRKYLVKLGITAPVKMIDHHASHAAYAYYSQPNGLDDCDVLVIDSIGEFETLSIWQGRGGNLNKIWNQNYPHSVGLWYSAMTQRLGLRPQEHEYILMGMAALGDPNKFYDVIRRDFIHSMPGIDGPEIVFKHNLHRGCSWWRPDIVSVQDYIDIAAAVQRLYMEMFQGVLLWMHNQSDTNKLAIAGGCALNCVANTMAYNLYTDVWIPANPGDAGSSAGAIMAGTKTHTPMRNAYLGTCIPGPYPVDQLVSDLETRGVTAVASGCAEFGPRALGNRSILADPRVANIKDRVNQIKQREEFRPFAPMILKEHAGQYFHLPTSDFDAPFMQYAVRCQDPQQYPGIVHVDGTSRIQTVGIDDNARVRQLLETWYARTGCPMLLNTSLNIKGEPLINTLADAQRWSLCYGLDVRS